MFQEFLAFLLSQHLINPTGSQRYFSADGHKVAFSIAIWRLYTYWHGENSFNEKSFNLINATRNEMRWGRRNDFYIVAEAAPTGRVFQSQHRSSGQVFITVGKQLSNETFVRNLPKEIIN